MGNVTSTALDNVMNKIAFKPPFPATYAHNLFGKVSYTHTISGHKIAFAIVKPDPISKFPTNEEKLEYNEDSIAIMSHGNAVDIGSDRETAQWLSNALNRRVIVYDYVNYGLSSIGITTEKNMHEAIEAIYNLVVHDMDIKPENVLLYGKSIGTAPTIYMASQTFAQNVEGVILMSPLASGIRTVMHTQWIQKNVLQQLDKVFCPSILYIKNISRPVLIIHGIEDDVIEIENGRFLHNSLSSLATHPPLWVHAKHNDIEIKCSSTIVKAFQSFVLSCSQKRQNSSKKSF